MKLGFLGPKGTFSEKAAKSMSEIINKKMEFVPFKRINDCILAAENGIIDMAVVPIENSIEGTVNPTVDTLIFDANLYARHSIFLPVDQSILAKKGTQIENIEKIYSHPQALAQCSDFLVKHCPNAKTFALNSTAEAAKFVSENNGNIASLGIAESAELYDLEVLANAIQNVKDSYTEFVLISKEKTELSTKGSVTTFAFSTPNEPGQLYKFLGILSIWDFNMTKILSRPNKNKTGEYVFLVDIENYKSDDDLKNAVELLQRKTSFFKNLGTYNITDLRK